MKQINIYFLNIPILKHLIWHGLGVRIAGSHPAGPGLIHGVGAPFCQPLFFVDPDELKKNLLIFFPPLPVRNGEKKEDRRLGCFKLELCICQELNGI